MFYGNTRQNVGSGAILARMSHAFFSPIITIAIITIIIS